MSKSNFATHGTPYASSQCFERDYVAGKITDKKVVDKETQKQPCGG